MPWGKIIIDLKLQIKISYIEEEGSVDKYISFMYS